VAAFLQNVHELEDGEGPADLQGGEPAVQAAQDPGVVAADIENLESLQLKVPVQGGDSMGRGATRICQALSWRVMEGCSSRSMKVYFAPLSV